MRKILLFLITALLWGNYNFVNAQCYGTVAFDASANGNGASTFNITTANANEMILISLDGYGSTNILDPGPVTVDGNNATLVNSAMIGNSATAEVWAYSAPAAGAHTIVCPETNFETPYYLNLAAAFYATGSCTPLTLSNLSSVENTVTDSTGGEIANSITTTAPNSMIYCDATFNTGDVNSFPISWANATFLDNLHEGNGIEASNAYQAEATAGAYTIEAANSSPYTGGGGLNLILVDITPPACGITVTAAATTEPTCGGSNGEATATATGGTTPYTYAWTPSGGSNAVASNLSAGTYTISVTDNGGCTGSATVTLTSTALSVTATVTANEKCNLQTDGSITATITGGTSPFTYLWTPGNETTATVSNLSAGTYTVTVKDANGCSGTASATITQPAFLTAVTNSTSATCGQNNGTASVSVTGGTGAYTYLWTPGNETTATISGLSAGNYTVTVNDSNGCNVNAAVTVANSSGINTSIIQTINILCNGASTGSATVGASGGTTPYTYSWAPSGGSNATASNLSAGTYTVTVKDANGCNTPAIVILTQPTLVRDSVSSITYPVCNGGTGSATIGVQGGVSPYTYLWNPGSQTTATVSGLTAGIYTVNVTDNHGCASVVSVDITQPAAIVVTTTVTPTTCNNSNGSATAIITGGTSPYTYLWNPGGQSGVTATGLSAGTYTITVTDINNCSGSTTAIVTATSSPTVTVISVTNEKCFGDTTGSATVSVTGGTSPYNYLWKPGGGSNATASDLSAGTYTCVVTDRSLCVVSAIVTITQPTPVIVTTSVIATTCNNNNGRATATVSGGTSPYTYLWNPTSQTGATATSLSVGTYTVTVTDSNGCSGSATATITAVAAPTITISPVTNEKCFGDTNASATANVTGGTPPYNYVWNPGGQSNATATGLSPGTYTVTVTDRTLCTATATVTITQPTPITLSAHENPTPCGDTLGLVWVSATGGTGPYTYLWNPSGQTTDSALNLSSGTYTCTVTDANGCTQTVSETVTTTTSILLNVSSNKGTLCFGSSNGSATIAASGGTSPYTYQWNPGGGSTATITTLSAGTYTVTVTDANGCDNTITVTITQPTPITLTAHEDPTPCGESFGSAWVTTTGGTGPYTYLWNPTGQTTDSAINLSAGTYTCTVTDANGCTQTASETVTDTSSIVLSISSNIEPTCFGYTNGSATIAASGGTSPYTYQWNPGGQTTPTVTTLSAGIYTVTVTDSKGCSSTIQVSVTQPSVLAAPISDVISVSCNGGSNGSISVSPSGGTQPYTYTWSTGATTENISGLSIGTYTLTLTDANGCFIVYTFPVTQPPVLTTTTSSTITNCSNNGTATATPAGGTPPYTYVWSPSLQTNATATGLSAGIYTVLVTDNDSCNVIDTVTVHSTSTLSIIASGTGELCNGGSTGTATVVASSGTPPYTYLWNPGGATTASISGLSAGSYTIIVTDNAGCTQFAVVDITQPAAISLTTTSTGAGCSNNSGSATVTATGGTGSYTYLWTGGGTTSTISGLGSGSYTITVTDSNNCSATAVATVASGGVNGSITASTNVLCFGNNNGSATVTITSGAVPYTYLWNPGGQTTATASGLSEGTYTVGVLDSNGCSFTASVVITGPSSALNATATVTNSTCNSSNNGSVNLTVTGGTPQYTFNWSNGSTTQNLNNILPGTYTVSITDSNGCTFTNSAVVGFDSSVFANAGNDTVICHNSTIALNGTGSINATSYAWYQMPGMVLLKDSSVVFVTPSNDTTTYILVVQHGTCTDTSSVTIIELASISVNPGPDQTIFGVGTVTLGGSPTGPGGSSYLWSPNSTLNDSLFANPAASPTVTTIYTVVVKNSLGCSASDTVTVFVLPGVTVPSGFTPNGDGVNDFWVLPFADGFPNIEVQIFNRWGQLLFQSNGYNTPWDGEYNGSPLPVGTYYYIINLNDPRFPKALTGPVTIMR
jgi:large repetitive protein